MHARSHSLVRITASSRLSWLSNQHFTNCINAYYIMNSCFPMFSVPLIRLLLLVAVSIRIAPLLMFEKHASNFRRRSCPEYECCIPTSPPNRSTQRIVGGCCDDCAAHCAGRCTGHWPRCDCWILSKWCCRHWSRSGPWPFCLLPGLCCSIPCFCDQPSCTPLRSGVHHGSDGHHHSGYPRSGDDPATIA